MRGRDLFFISHSLVLLSFLSHGDWIAHVPQDKTSSTSMTFDDYKKKKEADRSSKIKSKVDGRKKPKIETKMVKVQVGLVSDKESTGHLKKVKGRTIPVLLSTSDDANCVLTTAVEKHARHFKQFNKFMDYVLLYPDMSVVNYLPGSISPFTLQQYRDDLLKPYSKLYIWLCEKEEYKNTLREQRQR